LYFHDKFKFIRRISHPDTLTNIFHRFAEHSIIKVHQFEEILFKSCFCHFSTFSVLKSIYGFNRLISEHVEFAYYDNEERSVSIHAEFACKVIRGM